LNKIIYIILILLVYYQVVYATEKPVTFADARVMGMGNTFTAIADDKNMLFFNPAGFASYGLMKLNIVDALFNPTLWRPRYSNIGDLTAFSITIGASGFKYLTEIQNSPVEKLYELYKDGVFDRYGTSDITEADLNRLNNALLSLYTIGTHPLINIEMMSYARHYFGFGTFSSTEAVITADATEGIGALPNIQVKFNTDLIFPVGFGIPIPEYKDWSAGITLKYFQRIKLELENIDDLVAVYSWYEGKHYNDEMMSDLESRSIFDIMRNGINFSKVPIDQIKGGTGLGFDLGTMYRPEYAWKFGLLLSDVYTKINWWDNSEPSKIPINARIGAAWTPRWSLFGIVEDPVLAVDMEDLFHQQGKNFFLKWHFGTEVKFLFRLISLRFGINDGYPSYGLGIDFSFYFLSKIPVIKWLRPNRVYFPIFNPNDRDFIKQNPICCCTSLALAPLLYSHIKIDISYTGYELGVYPGQVPDYQLLIRGALSYSY